MDGYFFSEAELSIESSPPVRNILKFQDLLILDEWGYVPVDRDGLQLLFRVISDSYESKSLILTTNLEFSKWAAYFQMIRWRQQ